MDGLVRTFKYNYVKADESDHSLEVLDELSYFIGSVPVNLKEFIYDKTHAVFGSCETPCLIYINKDGNIVSDHIHSHEIR